MQNAEQNMETQPLEPKIAKIGNVLRLTGWIGLIAQIGFGAISLLMIVFAIVGRTFSQAVGVPYGVNPNINPNLNQGTNTDIGIGIFWAVCGILVLMIGIYLAIRQTRLSKRLRHADTMQHPTKSQIMNVLRLSVIVGLVGILLTIIGGGATLGVLFSKTIVPPQGINIYDPSRFIRSVDIMVAIANMSGIAAHFVGIVASLSIFEWLHR